MPELNPRLRAILQDSFYIRTTMTRRRSGGPRTVETTYYWNGTDQVVLSGYPGPPRLGRQHARQPDCNAAHCGVRAVVRHSLPRRGPLGYQGTPAPPAGLHRPVDSAAGLPPPAIRLHSWRNPAKPKTPATLVDTVLANAPNTRPDAVCRRHLHRRPSPPHRRPATPLRTPRRPRLTVDATDSPPRNRPSIRKQSEQPPDRLTGARSSYRTPNRLPALRCGAGIHGGVTAGGTLAIYNSQPVDAAPLSSSRAASQG